MVNDISGSPQGFDQTNDIATGDVDANNEDHTDDYAYDFNGNMKTDTNKGIEGITYNHLNLPTKILFSGTTNGNISYIYNAIGGKVKKVVEDNVANTTTDYLTGFQYKNTELQFFPHAEGYVHYTKPLATQGGENSALGSFNYVFNYTDHLGNVRLSYARDPLVGNRVKILEENHYYAFGLKHKNYNVERLDFDQFPDTGVELVPIPAVANASYNYKYNGIELQEELGLNMYDMDMRDYDPAIARWVVQDPVIHYEYSPYNAFDNNPVFWADPSGADSTSSQKDMLGRNTHDRWGNFIPFGDRYGSTELSLNNADDTEYYGDFGAWKAEQNEDGTYVTFSWQTKNIFKKSGNLKEGYFAQALLFFDHGTFDKKSNFNMGTASVMALLENGDFKVFEATTYPADDSKHAVIRDGLYIAKWGLHKSQGPALNLYNTIDGTSRIPIIQAIHPNPELRSQYDNVLGAYATGINIHWAYPGSKGYTTGFDSRGNACSIGCLLVRGTKKEYHRDFTSILNQKKDLGVILLRFPTN